MSTTDDYLAEVEQREQAATPGPWRTWADGHVGQDAFLSGGISMPTPGSYRPAQMPNAEFIAHARTDVPRLLAFAREVLTLAEVWDDPEHGPALSDGTRLRDPYAGAILAIADRTLGGEQA